MRIGRGAGPDGLNLQIIPFEERTDFDASAMTPDTKVWRVKDVFTTHNGNWEVMPAEQIDRLMNARVAAVPGAAEDMLGEPIFGIDQWARDEYLFPPNDPRYLTEGGADHHILVCVQNAEGERVSGAGVVFTSDGPQFLQPPNDPEKVATLTTKTHGWCDLAMYASSQSDPPAPGPWSTSRLAMGGVSDIVTGMGLPWRWHVSTFIVYEAQRWGDILPDYATLDEALQDQAQIHQVIEFNPDAALQKVIFADGFVPNSPEFDLTFDGVSYRAQRAEHLGAGVVRCYYAAVPNWEEVRYTEW